MSVKLNSSLGGSVSISESATAGDYTVTMPAANATMLVTPIPAGNTSVAAMTLTSGSLLSTAAAGAIEYDGKVLYATPQEIQRGVIPGQQFFKLGSNLTGTNATGAQKILGVGVSLSSNTSYAFELHSTFSKSAGTTSHTFSHLWGGTATITNVAYTYYIIATSNGTLVTNAAVGNRLVGGSLTSGFVMTGAITAAAYSISLLIKGTIDVNTGGTIIPQYSLSAAPGGAYLTEAGSYMLIYPIGTAGANTSVGAWA